MYFSLFQYFTGNRDRSSIVTKVLTPPIIARIVRIHPKGWYRHISMRVELYGFRPGSFCFILICAIVFWCSCYYA